MCIITENTVYEGVTFVTAENRVLPDKRGILMDKDGVYDGEFKRGKAHGKGKYTSMLNKTQY